MKVPGSRPWLGSLVGHSVNKDWDLNNGGVIQFFDGTIWAYSGESPASSQLTQDHPSHGFHILELAPGATAWESLTPDIWGFITNQSGTASGGLSSFPVAPIDSNFNSTGPMKGKLADFRFMGSGWNAYHSGENGDEFIYMLSDSSVGPLRLHRAERTWERFYTADSDPVWTQRLSNAVLMNGQIWWLGPPAYTGEYDGYGGWGVKVMMANVDDLASPATMHQFRSGYDPSTSRYWTQVENTGTVDVAALLDNQYASHLTAIGSIAIHDGWLYSWDGVDLIGNNPQYLIRDGRTTGSASSNTSADSNYDIPWVSLRRCRIGTWEWELLYYHRSPDGWVGRGADVGRGSWSFATIKKTTIPPGLNDAYSSSDPMIGAGIWPMWGHDSRVRDGWLYFVNGANQGSDGPGAVYGYGNEHCRIELETLINDAPVRHDPLDPRFETISNATHPSESYDGNIGRRGTHYYWREGARNLYGRFDFGWMFNGEGEIVFQHMTFPTYTSYRRGYGTRTVSKLTEPPIIHVTVVFEGNQLKGYSNVRQIAAKTGDTTLELK